MPKFVITPHLASSQYQQSFSEDSDLLFGFICKIEAVRSVVCIMMSNAVIILYIACSLFLIGRNDVTAYNWRPSCLCGVKIHDKTEHK